MTSFQDSKEFEKFCREADSQDFATFAAILYRATDFFQLTLRDLAEFLEVSPASVTRYMQGKNAPHPAMRRVHYERLAERAQAVLASHQKRDRALAAAGNQTLVAVSRPTPRGSRQVWQNTPGAMAARKAGEE